MLKEFDLNNYQYTETVLTFSQWLQSYKPQPNEFNHEARFSGLLYEHKGLEWEHVIGHYNQQQWTLFQDEDGTLKIKNGLVVRGRVGYFLCSEMHNSHATFIVTNIPEGVLEHRISENH
jgi:hypothetical protein